MMPVRWFLLLIFFCLLDLRVNAQGSTDLSESGVEWNPGGVEMTDGTVIKGLVRYQPISGILSLSAGDISKSFVPRMVLEFWYVEGDNGDRHTFYSVTDSTEEGDGKQYFFEVLKEFKTFAILSKIQPAKVELKENNSPAYDGFGRPIVTLGNTNGTINTITTETLFIFDADGKMTPYLKLTEKNSEGVMWFGRYDKSHHQKKTLDHDVIEDYTAPYYSQLKKYASDNGLKFTSKDDLMKILDYYGVLSGQSSVH